MKSYLLIFLTTLAISTGLLQCTPKGDGFTYAVISTEYGDMKVRLYNSTPQHRDNFIKLAKEGFYDDLLFHRVIQDFMIQGGDPDSKTAAPDQMLGQGGPGYTLPAEQRQRYLEVGGSPVLDGEYTVFGEVVEGLDVIDKIAAVPTGQANRPVRDVRMTVKLVD